MINNDFHPLDKGLKATDDHWGTQSVLNRPYDNYVSHGEDNQEASKWKTPVSPSEMDYTSKKNK